MGWKARDILGSVAESGDSRLLGQQMGGRLGCLARLDGFMFHAASGYTTKARPEEQCFECFKALNYGVWVSERRPYRQS
jgi:hypothetical protein